MPEIYEATQRRSVGAVVTNAGYKLLESVSLDGQRLFEVGPGVMDHVSFWRGSPSFYAFVDVNREIVERATLRLRQSGVPCRAVLHKHGAEIELPFCDGEFDIVLAFYTLEHLHPIESYLKEIVRILRPGGQIFGAIPCEGGLAWGCGRFLTTRRWFKRHTSIDPDKIICWEHPNFANGVLRALDEHLCRRGLTYWPFRVHSIDLNLVVSFFYEKD